jgi:hypothetical protein
MVAHLLGTLKKTILLTVREGCRPHILALAELINREGENDVSASLNELKYWTLGRLGVHDP